MLIKPMQKTSGVCSRRHVGKDALPNLTYEGQTGTVELQTKHVPFGPGIQQNVFPKGSFSEFRGMREATARPICPIREAV